MADANSIRIVYIFEACARLRCSSEIQALAAHIYHRFFRIKSDMSQYELYTFGSACILLAHRLYEQPLPAEDLAIVASSIVHEPGYNLDSQTKAKLASTIDFVSLVIAVNTNFELSFKDERMMTPGDLLKSIRSQNQEVVVLDDSVSVESDEIESDEDADFLLTNNSKHMISGHRYLAHYLYSIKLLIKASASSSSSVFRQFNRLCQVAWIFMTDFHWSPAVMCHPASHIACACLMMAIETCGKTFEKADEPTRAEFIKLLNKKWNLILCDDLSSENLARTIHTIMNHYIQFEQIFRKELTKIVIEP